MNLEESSETVLSKMHECMSLLISSQQLQTFKEILTCVKQTFPGAVDDDWEECLNEFDPPSRTSDMYELGWKVEEHYIDWRLIQRLSGKHTKLGTRTKNKRNPGASNPGATTPITSTTSPDLPSCHGASPPSQSSVHSFQDQTQAAPCAIEDGGNRPRIHPPLQTMKIVTSGPATPTSGSLL